MMPKSNMVDAILSLNPTAQRDFLDDFSVDELSRYLERLSSTSWRIPLETESCEPSSNETLSRPVQRNLPEEWAESAAAVLA